MELLCTVHFFVYPFSLFIILFVLSGHETDSLVSTSRLVEIWRLHPKQKAKTKSHWSVHRFVFAFAVSSSTTPHTSLPFVVIV